jgi:hypothetical protein
MLNPSRAPASRRSSRPMDQSLGSGVPPEAGVVQEGPPRRPVETTRVLIAVWRACADLLRSQLRRLGFGQPHQARPRQGCANIPSGSGIDLQNRNFLLWWDTVFAEVRLGEGDDGQSVDAEVRVSTHQRRAERERGRRHPKIVLIECQSQPLASKLNRGIEIAGPFRDGLARHRAEQLVGLLFEVRAALAPRELGDEEKNLTTNDSTGDYTIVCVESRQPFLDSLSALIKSLMALVSSR